MVEFFHQRTAVQFSRAAPCRTFTRRRVRRTVGGRSPRNPTMAACSETGSIACVRRWKPLAGRDGHRRRRGYGAFFNATRSPRSALYAARRLLRHGWQRLRAGRGSIWSMAMRWSPVCCDPPSTPACVFSSMPRWSGCCRVRRACPARCCAATAGRFTSKLAPWCWPAAVFPTIASGWRRWCPRGGGLRPFLRRTAGQSGRGIRLGESVGGQFDTSLRHPLARAPVSRVTLASGQQLMFPHLVERAKPGVIAVLPNGKRFVNEADSYHDFIAALLAATPAGDTPQARLLADRRTLRRYGTGHARPFPFTPPPAAYRLSAARKHHGGAGEAVRYRRQCAGGNR